MEKLREIKKQLRALNFRLQSKKGQVFLVSPNLIQKIIEAANLKKDDLVLEIGAGWGHITSFLAEKAKKVIALEIDRKLVTILKEKFKNQKNVKIIHQDILKIENCKLKIENYKVVANLPYNITGAVLRKLLYSNDVSANQRGKNQCESAFWPKPKLMVLILQKEVAQRILAKNKKNSIISLMVNFYSQPEIVKYVSRNNFWPRPKVDSAILRLTLINADQDAAKRGLDKKKFFQLIRQGFSSPRKQLINNLAKIVAKEKLKEVLNKFKINPQIRAEDLTLKDWINLYQKFRTS